MRPVGVVVAMLALAGCSSGATILPATAPSTSLPATTSPPVASTPGTGTTSSRTTRAPTRTGPRPTPTSGVAQSVQRIFQAMSEPERVGQLFMVGSPSTGASYESITAIESYHVGSVILTGTSDASVADTAAVSARLQSAAPRNARLLIATDQEGGAVQRLRGPGFDTLPSALQQGGIAPTALREDARRWGSQLRGAGVNLDLAPVADTVPSASFAGSNPPIGAMDRQYGYDPATVASQATAFAQGLADAGIDATLKHFPGLGRVTGNTDTTAGVTDRTTTRNDPYLAPFALGIKAGVPFVMMSTAYYARIDPDHPAAFSRAIVTGLLRGDLHFRGVVISDDLGGADQVAAFSPGTRAVDFVAAGGDIVLTVDAAQIPEMTAAVLDRVKADPAFRAQVDAAAQRVLIAKLARGLLTP